MRWRKQRLHGRLATGLTLATALLLSACGDSGSNNTANDGRNGGDNSVARTAIAAPPSGDSSNTVAARRAAPASDGFVVIRSMGPSAGGFANGTRIGADGVVTLAAGDRLVVTDGTQTRTLAGPGRFDLGTPVPATGNSVGTAQDYAEALVEGEGRSVVAATRRGAAPPGGGGPRQPPRLGNGTVVQVQLPPTGSIAPRPPRPRTDGPRVVRPRIDQVAPRVDSSTIAAAPSAPDAPVAARVQSPAVVPRQQPQP